MANENTTTLKDSDWAFSALNKTHEAVATLRAVEALILTSLCCDEDEEVDHAQMVLRNLEKQLDNSITIIDEGSISSFKGSASRLAKTEGAATCMRLERVYHSTRAIHQLSLDAIDRSNPDLCASYLGAISEVALANARGLSACVQKISKPTRPEECESEFESA